MAKRKKQRITGSRNFHTPKLIPLIFMIFILFVSALSLFLSSTLFKEHLVLSEASLWLAMSLLSLFIALVTLHSRMDYVMEKILVPIVIIGSLVCSGTFALTTYQLFSDKRNYEDHEFKISEGVPSEISFDGSKYGADYLSSITIHGVEVKVAHLNITRTDYLQELKNKPLKLQYLPHSRFAVAVTLVIEEEVQKQ